MKKIACLGSEAFSLGFRLSGIKDTINANEKNILDQIYSVKQNKEIGVVIVDETLLEHIDSNERELIEDSVDPVFIQISTKSSSDNIRKLIIKSMGVDLWRGDSE